MSTLKLPGGALFFNCTQFLFPTGFQAILPTSLVDKQKINLSSNVGRNSPPALFVTVDCLKRHPEEFSQLFLSFSKFFSGKTEFFLGQKFTSSTLY